MQHAQDEQGWDEWFDAAEEQEEVRAPRRRGIVRYIAVGLAIEAVVLVVALVSA